ncbi:fimbrial protein [Cupriavidus sp. 30B13]|uniref:fimbrial protein n=1 Tax=Cupriavidus sp. 30B13 TaxID=3384241 RepID=UPI003B8FF3B5
MKHYLRGIVALLIGLGASGAANAALDQSDCYVGSGSATPPTLTVPLAAGALTIGRDVPDGTVIYSQTVSAQTVSIDCKNYATATVNNALELTTSQPLAAWNQGPYAGKVYESGLPGIGVAIRDIRTNRFYPDLDTTSCLFTCIYPVGPQYVEISLIKTGQVSASGPIAGASLPRVISNWRKSSAFEYLQAFEISFAGSLSIVSRTCATPDVTVRMGSHGAGGFSGAGSATPWKGFDIRLQDCPAFHGAAASVSYDNGVSNVGTTANQLGFVLTPVTQVVDAAKGIVALSAGSEARPAAGGVGLQIATQAGTPVTYGSVMPSGIAPAAAEGGSYTIPLQARYVQTGESVTPGRADTSVMFTIDYK